jgi:Tfp pilus assembly pilus retraction ATPase PilT
MHIIEIIANIIKEHKIKDISSPFNEKFWHVMQTIQGQLSNKRNYVETQIKENKNGTIELSMKF